MNANPSKTVAKGPAGAERRSSTRRRVLKGAVLRFNRGYGAIECVVRNQSADGALLVFGDACGVPPSFDITITGDTTRPAQVRWRGPDSVGIALG